ncbi:MAG: DNA primase [Bacteroidales bacterium]|nr:DNA primase [Bacteroidales bacterium]MCM1147929.1 DNA primase [Bacteroidales bacterium]MCM1205478.1 DNA primase [Bacillota bacterium]MCM1509260.1 DNA primase [Clostridium sp.]
MIDRITTAKILEAADIVDVVSEFVTLRKAGANYKGLCPFHDDKTPSFSVSPSRNYCHCFSCGKGGTPVGFIMEHEQMTYPEALRWLAKKYHIEIKERELSNEEKQQESERESMFIVNEWAAKYYHDILHTDADGRAVGMQYFRSRGFRDDIIEKFRLGFALPARQAMPREALAKGYKAQFLLKTGLCYSKSGDNAADAGVDKASLVDRFAGRAIFPWIGMSGKVVAFGGRKLDKETKGVQQKYVNSPDSDIYHKDHELYGIYQAKKQISKEDRVFMVEGYTDVISMHQCGIENVVANSGTALSIHQIHMLHRLTKNIVLLYDGDAAGIKAAMRGTDMLLSEGMNIKVLILPDGDDPDSFAKKHTPEEFRDYVERNQTDFIQFKTDVLMKDATDPVRRSEVISSIIKSVSVIPDPIIRAAYLQDCATRLRMDEKTLLTKMNRFISDEIKERDKRKERERATAATSEGTARNQPIGNELPPEDIPDEAFIQKMPKTPVKKSASESIERLIMQAVVRQGDKIVMDNVETEDGTTMSLNVTQFVYYNLTSDGLSFSTPLYNRMLACAMENTMQEGFRSDTFFSKHPDIEISTAATEMLTEHYTLSKSLELKYTKEGLRSHLERLLMEFRRDIVDARLNELMQKITAFGNDMEKAMPLLKEYQEQKNLFASIAKQLGNNIR